MIDISILPQKIQNEQIDFYQFLIEHYTVGEKILLANMTPRAFLPQSDPSPNDGQLSLLLNFEN